VSHSLPELDEKLASLIDPQKAPGMAWGVVREGEWHTGAAGFANKETGLRASPQIPFAMASVTKPMTTTAIAILAARGLIDLDKPINDYLGEARVQSRAGDASKATVRAVADHSAGLPLHYQFYYQDEPFTRPPFDETIRRYAKTFAPVGARHDYSNLGYGLLDYVVEQVSGRPYGEFMAEEVFQPLGMTASSIGAPKDKEYAVSYGPDGAAYPLYDFDHPGGSAAYASVEDLLRFGLFHLGNGPALLTEAQLEDMHWITAPIEGSRGYGFGWGINDDRWGYRIVEHTGFMGGVSAVLRLVPKENLVIAIVANGQTDLTWKSAGDAMAVFLPDYGEKLEEDRLKAEEKAVPVALPASFYGNWKGTIETHEGNRTFELDILGPYEAWAAIDGRSLPVSDLQLKGGRLVGAFEGDVKTGDVGRRPYRIHLDLAISSEGALEGAANTISKTVDGGGGALGKRFGNALAYWVMLRR